MIAHYDFSDGNLLDNEVGDSYALTKNGSGVTLNGDGSAQIANGSGSNFLSATGIGDGVNSAFTISIWFRTDTPNPATHSSIASGAASSTWQLENVQENGPRLNSGTSITGSSLLIADTWYQAVVWTNGTNSKLFMSEEGGSLTQIGATSNAALGLTDLRLGVNRGGNHNWEGDYANIQVYDEALSNTSITTILDAGSGVAAVPEPSASALLGLGSLALILRRKK